MDNKNKKVLGGDSTIKISLAIIIVSALVGFAVRQEARITKLETIIENHDAKISKLENRVDINREILIKLQSVEEDVADIKKRLDVR